jgi:hypothetical protein
MIEVTLEAEQVEPVAGLEHAADGVGVQASTRLRIGAGTGCPFTGAR